MRTVCRPGSPPHTCPKACRAHALASRCQSCTMPAAPPPGPRTMCGAFLALSTVRARHPRSPLPTARARRTASRRRGSRSRRPP
eukprot:1556039-Prymnesium_polylepis.1